MEDEAQDQEECSMKPRPMPDLDEIRESIRKLETTAGERGARTWNGPRTPEPSARKKAHKAQKAARKVNR